MSETTAIEPWLREILRCPSCHSELLDGTSRMSRDGAPVHHFFTTSAFAEYTIVTESGAIPIPADVPFDRACVIGCGVMTGIGAVVRKARVAAGSSVAVIGCGAVGLNAVQGARLVDASRIIAVDLAPERSVLDGILQARNDQDGSIGIRCSCQAAICGSCGVRINGQPGLACHTHLDKAQASGSDGVIVVEPMGNETLVDVRVGGERLSVRAKPAPGAARARDARARASSSVG